MVLVRKKKECLYECKRIMFASAYVNELEMLVNTSCAPLKENMYIYNIIYIYIYIYIT